MSADGRVLVEREEAGAEEMGSGCKRNDSGCGDCLKKHTSSKCGGCWFSTAIIPD